MLHNYLLSDCDYANILMFTINVNKHSKVYKIYFSGYTQKMEKRETRHTTTTETKPRGVAPGAKRPWVAGRPKFKNGELQRVTVLLSDKHARFLKEQESASALIRMLLDRYIRQKEQQSREPGRKNLP